MQARHCVYQRIYPLHVQKSADISHDKTVGEPERISEFRYINLMKKARVNAVWKRHLSACVTALD